MQAQVTLKACLKCSHNIGRNLVTRSRVAVRVMRSYNSAPLFGAKPVITPFRGEQATGLPVVLTGVTNFAGTFGVNNIL